MRNFVAIVASLAALAALGIGAAGLYIVVRRPGMRRNGLLMVLAALITLINVWLLVAPPG